MRQQNSCSGNVLFLILIAVALFAALSYAVTNSTRGGGGNASKESAQTAAAELVQYSTSMQQAIMRMKLINGCSDNDISFYQAGHPALQNYGHTPQSPNKCNVFHPDGGGIAYKNIQTRFPAIAAWAEQNFRITGSTLFFADDGCNSESCYDLILVAKVPQDVCQAVADQFGTVESNGTIVEDSSSVNVNFFDGNYGTAPVNNFLGDNAGNKITVGKPTGCLYWAQPGWAGYYYYHVLIMRG